MHRPNVLAQTAEEFVQAAVGQIGKGVDQALSCYRGYWQKGNWETQDPCFANCPRLRIAFQEIIPPSPLRLVNKLEERPHVKCVFELHDGLQIETVLIQMQAGVTVCVSSQVGCRMGCAFCETGRMGLLRSLSPEEIVAQVWCVRHLLGYQVRNLVFMGMGEPFDNFDAVRQAVRVLTDPHGMGLGGSRITISTVGRIEGIQRFQQELPPTLHLAVSLNAPDHDVRRRLMPIETTDHMDALRQALESYGQMGRSVLLEYILLEGITDELDHADALARWVEGLSAKINCIPYNPQSRARFKTPSEERIQAFLQRLREHGISPLLRHHRGRAAMAACGQLGNLELRYKARTKERAAAEPDQGIDGEPRVREALSWRP